MGDILKKFNPQRLLGAYKMVPPGVEIDKPLPRRAPFILYFTIPNTIPQPSATDNSPRPVTPQTVPPRKRELHSAWSVAHGVTTFFLPQLELLVETLDCSQWILHFALNGDPELALLLAKLEARTKGLGRRVRRYIA
jgi:hypothetical protein